MTDQDPGPARYAGMSFNSPMSDERADAIADRLSRADPASVLDLGCGWGELLLRLVAASSHAVGMGVDTDAELLARGRRAARGRGLDDRVTFEERSAAVETSTADVVACVGASHAIGTTAEALAFLRKRVRPGGRVLFGEGTWEPLLAGDVSILPDDIPRQPALPDLVDLCLGAGFRVLHVEEASTAEWDDFESRYLAASEEWLLAHPDAPNADEVRQRADTHRTWWLRGYRRALGMAYITLGVPA